MEDIKKIPNNRFISSKQAVEIYNKDDKNPLSNIPNVPENLKKN